MTEPENNDFDLYDESEAGAGWRALALAVICAAGRDAMRGDLAAWRWLREIDENDPWLAISGANGKALREWTANGCKQQGKRRPGRGRRPGLARQTQGGLES